MQITQIKPRKDGKFLVTMAFDSGKRIKNILTKEKLEEWKAKESAPVYHKTPFDQ